MFLSIGSSFVKGTVSGGTMSSNSESTHSKALFLILNECHNINFPK